MRKIKFRGWCTRKKRIFTPEEMGRDQLTIDVNGRGFINVSGKSTELSKFYDYIIPEQFTGLLDKNGKEIYEGDIIKSLSQSGVVKQKEGCWIADWIKRPNALTERLYPHIEDGEVVGNIHERGNDDKHTTD